MKVDVVGAKDEKINVAMAGKILTLEARNSADELYSSTLELYDAVGEAVRPLLASFLYLLVAFVEFYV